MAPQKPESWYMQYDRKHDMPMVLTFDKWTFHGLGKDDIGMFAIIQGQYTADKTITFVKQYKKYSVNYKGKVTSWKNPFSAEGMWTLQNQSGRWGIVLQGSPTFGAVKKPKQESSVEGWFHSALQWCPLPFVATSYDLGASLYYLATGNREKAKERLGNAGENAAWDVFTIVTAGEGAVEREAVNGARVIEQNVVHAAGGAAEAAARDAERGFSRQGTMEFNAVLDTEEEVTSAAELQFQTEAQHGAGDGALNRAGSYSEIARRHSLRSVSEANHIPPYSSVRGTPYDIGRGNMMSLSTEHGLHQGLNRLFGSTGASDVARDIQNSIRNHLLNHDLPSALKLQILVDYGYWGALAEYKQGLVELIHKTEKKICTDGTPFLRAHQRDQLLAWLDEHINRYRRSRVSYIEEVEKEILHLA